MATGLPLTIGSVQGADLQAVFAVRGNSTAIRALNPRGCTQAQSQ